MGSQSQMSIKYIVCLALVTICVKFQWRTYEAHTLQSECLVRIKYVWRHAWILIFVRYSPIIIGHIETIWDLKNLKFYASEPWPLSKCHKNRVQGPCLLSKSRKDHLFSIIKLYIIEKDKILLTLKGYS